VSSRDHIPEKNARHSAGILEWTAVTLAGVIATAGILRFAAPGAAYCPAAAPIVVAEQSGTQAETAAIIKDMMRHD
jgi:hypothetical protein